MIRRFIVRLLAFYLAVFAGAFAVLFFTPLPMGLYIRGLERMGATVTDASGTLYGGVTIGKIAWKDPASGVEGETEGLSFRYSRVFEVFKTRRIEIDHYTIDKLRLKLPAGSREAIAFRALGPGAPAKDETAPKPEAAAPRTALEELAAKAMEIAFTGERPLLRGFGIGELRISDTRIEMEKAAAPGGVAPAPETFELRQALYRGLSVGPGFSLAELQLANDRYEFRARGIAVNPDAPRIDEIEGKLKVAFDPDRLRRDLDLSVKLEGSLKQWPQLKAQIQAVDGKIRARVGPNGLVSLAIAGVTVRELYAEPFPITNLDLETNEASFMALWSGAVEARGGFHIGTTPFRFVPVDAAARANGVLLRATATVGQALYTVDVVPPRRIPALAAVPGATPAPPPATRPPLALYSTFSPSAQDNLAFLLHGAMYADLDDVKRLQVDTDLKHFDLRAPAAPKRVAQGRKAAPAKAAGRAPAGARVPSPAPRR